MVAQYFLLRGEKGFGVLIRVGTKARQTQRSITGATENKRIKKKTIF
jgi:hypothetical protein